MQNNKIILPIKAMLLTLTFLSSASSQAGMITVNNASGQKMFIQIVSPITGNEYGIKNKNKESINKITIEKDATINIDVIDYASVTHEYRKPQENAHYYIEYPIGGQGDLKLVANGEGKISGESLTGSLNPASCDGLDRYKNYTLELGQSAIGIPGVVSFGFSCKNLSK